MIRMRTLHAVTDKVRMNTAFEGHHITRSLTVVVLSIVLVVIIVIVIIAGPVIIIEVRHTWPCRR